MTFNLDSLSPTEGVLPRSSPTLNKVLLHINQKTRCLGSWLPPAQRHNKKILTVKEQVQALYQGTSTSIHVFLLITKLYTGKKKNTKRRKTCESGDTIRSTVTLKGQQELEKLDDEEKKMYKRELFTNSFFGTQH